MSTVQDVGRVSRADGAAIWVDGLSHAARIGDRLRLFRRDGQHVNGEVLRLGAEEIAMLPDSGAEEIGRGDRVALLGPPRIAPSEDWIGRVVDAYGRALDGRPLVHGAFSNGFSGAPPNPTRRRPFGQRIDTGLQVFNTILPLVRGQRVGLFAGSGVGKSTLTAHFVRHAEADVVVLALVGERGRELRDFIQNVLGPKGMSRTVVVAATSDRSAVERRRSAMAAMTVAEYFRDRGKHVLFVLDSITRFAEAHREAATAAGELPALRGYPASTAHQIMSLCERAGPGADGAGDITGLFSVLVAGSDMDEPVADILRGVLDGHVVLDRKIAERGRYPAVDVLRSVSRSLPGCANTAENALLAELRGLLGRFTESETMIRAGLYKSGTDPSLDRAITLMPDIEAFLAEPATHGITGSFARLARLLGQKHPAGTAPITVPARSRA